MSATPAGEVAAPMAADANRAAYDARWKRVMDCVALRQPDRMPVAMYATFWLAKYGGVSHRQLMYDVETTARIAERAELEFEPDVYAPMLLGTAMGPSLEAVGFRQLQWPGHGVGDHQPYQYLDREYMKPEEYDEFIDDPTGFYLRTYLPRIASVFEGFEQLPLFPGLYYTRLVTGMRPFAKPQVRAALERLTTAADEVDRFMRAHQTFTDRMTTLGYPCTNGTTGGAPYDVIADYFRGARGMMTDLHRRGDKVLEVLDKATRFLLKQFVTLARASGNPIVFIPIHWAPDTFMSDKQFRRFWWPSFRQLMIGLIDEGLIPMPLWESDCTKRLEIIADIPPGKCIYWFERTDMVKAHEVLGDVVALRGNLSPSLLTTGTPQEVDGAVRHLAENVFHKGGKLILDAAFGLPDETPVENVRAMFDAARKYGS